MINPRGLCFLLSSVAVSASPTPVKDTCNAFSLPSLSLNYKDRAAAIQTKRKGWLYEDYPIGGAFYPTGTLANKTIAEQQAQWFPIVIEHAQVIAKESEAALAGVIAVGKLHPRVDRQLLIEDIGGKLLKFRRLRKHIFESMEHVPPAGPHAGNAYELYG